MSRRYKEVRLTDEQIVKQYGPTVFHVYAKNFFMNKIEKNKDKNSEQINSYQVHSHGTIVKRIVRVLHEHDIFSWAQDRSSPIVNLNLFNKEAPSLARLDLTEFQLDTKNIFTFCMNSRKGSLDRDDLNAVGGVNLNEVSTESLLWAYFNQDKIYLSKKKGDYGTQKYVLYLKDQEKEITRYVLLKVLFDNLRFNPTEYLAKFYGTEWVGPVSDHINMDKHDALGIIKNPSKMALAEQELRRHAKHFIDYANMLQHIKGRLRGDRTTFVTEFLTFMIKDMIIKSPLNLDKAGYKSILENAHEFTFENLFPNGLTKEQIEKVLANT